MHDFLQEQVGFLVLLVIILQAYTIYLLNGAAVDFNTTLNRLKDVQETLKRLQDIQETLDAIEMHLHAQ
jgi:hypothetical protein